jgi:hypothetical protein
MKALDLAGRATGVFVYVLVINVQVFIQAF